MRNSATRLDKRQLEEVARCRYLANSIAINARLNLRFKRVG